MTITAIYGFVKGSVVTFIVSALIQGGIRRQLLVAQRKSPRVRFKTRLTAHLDREQFDVTTRDISKGGLLIEPGRSLRKGQQMDLSFAFGMIQAKVQWVSKQFAGLSIIEESSNVDKMHRFIINRVEFSAI